MKTKTQFMNRILSLVLSIMMVISMLPTNVFTASAEAEESNRVIYCDIGPWTSLTGLELKYSSDNSTINEIVMEKVSDNIWKADLTTNDLTGQTIQFVGENVMSVGTVVPADKNCFRITEYNGTTVGYEGVWYQYPCASHDYKDGICACGVACTHTGGTATCQNPAVCEACGVTYGDLDANIHTPTEGTIFTVNENGTHNYTCACGAAVAEVPHTLDVTTGKCVCGADMTAIATVTDGTNTYYAADAATLNQAVTAILETGSRTFTVELPADAEAGMITTIRRAICDTEGVADGSIHLTLKGVTTIPGTTNWDGVAFGPRNAQWDENNVEIVSHEEVTQLASVNLPDVTEIGAQAFYFCENLVTVSAPKAQTIGAQALGYTALTSVEFPELTTIPTDMFSGTWTLSSAKFPKVTTIEQGGLLVGAKFMPENNPTPFPLELTAEGNITFNGSNHFNIKSQNYSGKVDLVLCCDKADKVTKNEDGTATWQVRDDLSYTFKSITFKHSYVDGKCTACGEDCAHTGGTATCTTLAVCDICKTAYGELGGHTYNTAGSCTVCGAACPHSNFDSATGNCKDCEISLAIAKVETGGNTIYYQTADELRTAVDLSGDDQTLTLLADLAIKDTFFFNANGTKNTLDLNGHTLICSDPISERILLGDCELAITGTGSINIFMGADSEGSKIVVGSGVTLNNSLRSAYGGVLDLTNATIPEAGLNVILYSDDWDPTTYNVSDVLLLPADYYFFMDGKAVYTYSGETEGTVLKHAEHNYTYTDNGDGTHDATCTACGAVVDNEAHSGGTATCTEQAECQHCGASYGELAAHTPDTNGKCTVENCGYQYAAKVGDTFYETIHKALRAAEGINGCTLTLLDDVTLTSMSSYASYVNTGTFTLDLNGKTLSSNKRTLEVMGSADLTIRDSIGGGKIVSTNSSAVYLSGGKLTIESGTFEGTLDGVFLSGTSTLIVKGGTFTGSRAMITGFGSNVEIDLTAIDPAGFTLKNNGSGTFAPKLPEGYGMVGSDGKLLTSLSAEQSATVHKHEYKYTDLGDGNHQQACSCGLTTGEPAAHSTTAEDDKGATCAASAYCSVCESYYGEVDKNNHDETVAYENGFCPYCDAFEPAELVDGVYEISNAGQLYWFAQQVNGGNTAIDGKLTTNIVDNTGDVAGCNGTKAEGWRDWTPIGTSNDRYTGTFDGGSFTVSGLYFNNSGTSNVGLFGYIGGDGAVHDLGVVNSYISGGSDVGVVVGYALATVSVTNCYNSATVIGVNYVGGVVGYSAGPIANCHNSGTVCGTGGIGAAGGVVGRCYRTVTNCHNTGSVTGTGSLGGVVGANSGTVTNCYNTGNVSGSGNGVGGVAGTNTGTVTNCYNTGNVTGSKYTVGGMVGANSGGTVTNCYNTGSVTGSKYYVGGVVGQNGNAGTVTNCYYLTGCAKDGNDAVQFGIGSGTQGNTTADAEGGTTGKSDFSTGEVCYLLNGDQTSVVFKQTCGTGIPVFTGETVYYGYTSCGDTAAKYTNDSSVSAEKPDHTQKPTYTDNGDGTHSASYSCCGTTVTEDHTPNYTAKDNVITAVCSANCGYSETATIIARDATYDGLVHNTATVDYSEGWKGGELTVSYENNVNAGTATASITIGEATANVDFTIAKATPTAEDFIFTAPTDLIYDGTAKPATITVKDGIVGMGEVNIIYFRDAGMWIDNEREPIYPGRYKVGIWIKEGDNYKAVYSDERIWLGSDFEIKYLTTDAKADISGTMGSNGWYTSDVTLTAPEGYQISKTKYNDGFESKLTISAEQNETITYYLKDANGDVAEKTATLKIDKTAPSAQYQIGTNGWKQFINTITFGLFCKDYKTVDIEYTDDLSGVAEKHYYISSEEIIDTSSIAWLDYTDTLSLNATGKYFIYMRVVDNAGHEVILNTEGIVIYEDSVQVTESVSATYNAGTDKAVTVKLNGNTVNAIKNGNAVLTAGTDYTVSADGTITLKASYLDALKAGEYTFTVFYNPQGVETDKVNMTTAFTVKVEKADGKVSNLNISGKTYDGTAVTAPTFDKPGDGAATIEYKVRGADDSTYTTTAPKDAGDYIVRVTVAEGTNHKAASATAEFTIDKAAITVSIQNATSVYGDTLAELKATDNGIVNGDANVYSLATTATGTSNVGKYAITGTALDSNYDVTFVNGEYEITKREITITVDAKNTVVNTTLPTYTYKVEGLVGVDALVTEPTLTCNAKIAVIGEYDITASGADAGGNYSIKYVPAKLTVLTDNAVDAAAGYTEELKDYDPATVTSEDKAELEEMLSEINTILADETTTDNGKKALEEVKEQVEKLIKEITDAAEATDTENTEKVENVTPENVTPENKTDLEGAKADLEKALDDNGGNYTVDEKKAIEDEIKRIDEALEVIGNVEAVEEVISKLPAVDTVKPDDEEAIKAITDAQTAYNALSDYEKSLVNEATKANLDKLVAALVAYDIVEGDGSSWTEDSDHSITFVVNGLFSKFVGIKIDGKDVDKANYEVNAGSTIITLKASYLDTLAVGEHSISVVYTDGSTDGTFNVHAKANSPATGDDFNIALYGSLVAVSVTALVVLLLVSKKRGQAR